MAQWKRMHQGKWFFAVGIFWAASLATAASGEVWRGGNAAAAPLPCEASLVSWNIERGERLPAVSAWLTSHRPSLALLQEVDIRTRRAKQRHVAEELARSLKLNFLFAPEYLELTQGTSRQPAYQGQAMLTSWPVLAARMLRFQEQTTFWEPRWFLPNWRILQRRTGGRVAQVAEFGDERRKLVVYNLHLESRGGEDFRLRQMQEVLTDIGRYPPGTPIVVAGDLNTRDGKAPAAAEALAGAGFRRAVGNEVTTVHGTPLDWIFIRGPLDARQPSIHRSVRNASDHFPLSVQILHRGAGCPVPTD